MTCLRNRIERSFWMSPYPKSPILASAADTLSIRAPIDGINLICVAWQVKHELALGDIPDFQCRVLRSTNQKSWVSWPSHLIHRCHMATERCQVFSCLALPKLDWLVEWSRYEVESIRRECNLDDQGLVSSHACKALFLFLRLPHVHREVIRATY